MINNSVYSNAGVNRDLQRPCVISQVTGLAVSYAGSVGIAISAGTESATNGTVVLSNGGGVAFGMNASTITALHSGNVSATGNTLATNSVSMTVGSALVFAGSGGASVGVSNGSVVISGATGGGGGGGGVALSAGTNSTGTGTVVFSNANGVTFGMNTNAAITASTGLPINADGDLSTVTELVFTNSNGISFGLTAGSVSAAHNGITSQSNQAALASVVGNTLAGMDETASLTLSRFYVSADGNVSVGLSASSLVVSVPSGGAADGFNRIAVVGSTATSVGTVVFTNTNGISFSLNAANGSVVSIGHALQYTSNTSAITSNALHTSASRVINIVAATDSTGGGTASLSSNVSFSNANGFTFYTSAGSALALSASQATLSNSNNVSFGLNAGVITATATFSQSNQTGNVSATGNTIATNSTSATYNATGLVFAGSGVASVGVSNGSVVVSVPAGGGAADGFNHIAVNGSTATSLGTVVFTNTNGISFSLNGANGSVVSVGHELQYTSNTSAITSNALHTSASRVFNIVAATDNTAGGTASLSSNVSFSAANGATFYTSAGGAVVLSYSVPTVTNSSMTVSDAATSGTLARLAFTNLNGVTLSLSTGAGGSHTIVGSHNALTSQSVQRVSAANGSYAFETLSFSNANGVSFGTSAGSAVTASHNGLTSQSNQVVSANNGSVAFQTLSFSNVNGVTFEVDAANTAISVTHALQFTSATSAITSNALHTSSPRINLSAGTTSNNLSAVTFANANGITFGLNASTVTASHNGITSQSAQTLGLYAVSNTTGQSSSSTVDARTLSFHGAGIASVGYSGGSVVISVPSGGGAGDGYNFIAVTNSTANSTARVLFQDSNGISFGMSGSNSATVSITASVSQAVLSNSNNVSFGINAGTITATATWPSLLASFGTSNTSGSTQTLSGGSLVFAAGSNITLSGSTAAGAQTITIHGASGGGAGEGAGDGYNLIAVTNSTANSTAQVLLQNSNGLTFGMSGSGSATVSITMSQDMRWTRDEWANMPHWLVTNVTNFTATAVTNRIMFVPLEIDRPLTWNQARLNVSRATSGSDAMTIWAGLYSYVNKTQLSSIATSSGSYSNTATASNSGLRFLDLPALTGGSTLTPGRYVFALLCSGAATASQNYSLRGASSIAQLGLLAPGANQYTTATSAMTSVGPSFLGVYSTTTGGLPESVGRSQVTHWTAARPYYLALIST